MAVSTESRMNLCWQWVASYAVHGEKPGTWDAEPGKNGTPFGSWVLVKVENSVFNPRELLWC